MRERINSVEVSVAKEHYSEAGRTLIKAQSAHDEWKIKNMVKINTFISL